MVRTPAVGREPHGGGQNQAGDVCMQMRGGESKLLNYGDQKGDAD